MPMIALTGAILFLHELNRLVSASVAATNYIVNGRQSPSVVSVSRPSHTLSQARIRTLAARGILAE